MKVRNVIAYKHYFIDFVKSLSEKMQDKVVKTIQYVETLQIVPEKYLKHIAGTRGLYEIRVKFSSDIIRVFCFFDGEKMVILLSGFQKKTQKTPKKEIDRAVRLMQEYFNEKEKERKKRDIRNFLQQIRQNRIIKRKKRDFLERMHNVQIDYEIY